MHRAYLDSVRLQNHERLRTIQKGELAEKKYRNLLASKSWKVERPYRDALANYQAWLVGQSSKERSASKPSQEVNKDPFPRIPTKYLTGRS